MPRLFLTWFAEPEDPHYWEYFRVDGIVVSLKSLLLMPKWKFNRALSQGFRKQFNYDGPLIIDSMLTNIHKPRRTNVEIPQSFVMYSQYLLGSDLLVQRDYPLIGVSDPAVRNKLYHKNLMMAEAALKYGESLGKEVMLVAQGWDLDTYVKSAEYYRNLGAKYIGIGSLVPHRSDIEFLVKVVKGIREAAGKVYLHLFGVTGLESLPQISKYIDSVDVSTPAIAASKKELIVIRGETVTRVKTTTVTGMKTIAELMETTNDSLERKFLEDIFSARRLRDKNLSTMIYNAYALLKFWNARVNT